MADGIVDGIVDKATNAIIAADLTPIEHRILVAFIKDAEEPTLAAQEVLHRIRDDDRPVEETLRVLKNDWHNLVAVISHPTPVDAALADLVGRRDQFRCCVTPHDCEQVDAPEPTFIIPPILSELGDADGAEVSKSLLDAFMTPPKASRLRSMLSDRSDLGRIANTLLLTPSILHAFRNGHLAVHLSNAKGWNNPDEDAATDVSNAEYPIWPIYPENYDDILLADRSSLRNLGFRSSLSLETEDPKQLPLPSPFLIKTHSKFANALHQFYVEERIALGWGPLASPSYLSRNTQLFARTLWHLVPKFIRTACYCYLLNKGKSKYIQDISPHAQQLPLGLYAKRYFRGLDNEANALRLVEQHAPSIPAPLLIDTFHGAGDDWFVSTSLPGERVHDVLHRMSYPERHQLAADLSTAVAQMRKIPNTTPYRYANVSGGEIKDLRLDCGGNGPYNSEADLNTRIAGGVMDYLMKHVPTSFSRSHPSVFTHGDLFFTNVLVDGGRLSGIVDWEEASYMPAYWEFTKVMRTAKTPEAIEIYREIWGEEYEMELETERFLWKSFPLGG